MADLFEVIAKHGAWAHFYANDGQLYISVPALRAEDTIRQFTDCLCEVEAWMRASRLRLNPQKTQLIWLGSRQQRDKLNVTDIQLLSTTLHPQSTVRSLGVILKQSVDDVQSYHQPLPIWLLSTATASWYDTVTHTRRNQNAGSCVHQQPS